MKWYIVAESYGLKTNCFPEGLTREEAIKFIENNLETGNLTRENYLKVSPYLWEHQYNKAKFIHLVNQKQLEKMNVTV